MSLFNKTPEKYPLPPCPVCGKPRNYVMEQNLDSIYEKCKIDIPLKFEILGSIDMEIIHDMKMAAIYGISTKFTEPIGILTVPDEEYEDVKKQIEEMGMEIVE